MFVSVQLWVPGAPIMDAMYEILPVSQLQKKSLKNFCCSGNKEIH